MTAKCDKVRIPMSEARECLSSIVMAVQDQNQTRILVRHGKAVAAVVSIASLHRIRSDEEMERWADPRQRGTVSVRRPDGSYPTSDRETAELVREVQLTRALERKVLARAGMEPMEGGELALSAVEVVGVEEKKRRWWGRWFG